MHAFDCCNLGSLNLARFVAGCDDPASVDWYEPGNPDTDIDWVRLHEVTRTAIRALDDVIDITAHPIADVNRVARANRRIGLGIMGFSDMLTLLRIPYASAEGRAVADRVMRTINDAADEMSEELALEKGSFPNHHLSVFHGVKERRNAATTNIAPTGTTAMIADVNGGLEPAFALVYAKGNILGGLSLRYVNRYLEAALRAHGLYTDEVLDAIAKTGSVSKLEYLPAILRTSFQTAMDISPQAHVEMQAAFQRHLSNSCSKTSNLPNSASVGDVINVILEGWRLKCRGLTVYRDGSRVQQVLTISAESIKTDRAAASFPTPIPETSVERETSRDECPDCKKVLRRSEGCVLCESCGYGKCSS